MKGDSWTDLIHPDDLPEAIAKRAEAWQTRSAYRFEGRFRRFDGAQVWMHVTCKPRFDSAGELIGYVGIASDITEAKRAEIELRASESLLRAMFDNAGVGMVLMDRDSIIRRANAAFAKLVGRPVEALIGTRCLDITHPEDVAANDEAMAALDAGANAFAFE
jgi:PAS domain-containing protein